MHVFSRLIREPILHFLVIGALLFVVYAAFADTEDTTTDADTVVISETVVAQAVAQFRQTWRRPPTADELDALIRAAIREEILVREALSLSMDAGDPVIRRRLAQKMEFLVDSGAAALVPTDEELRAHFEANIANYTTARQIAFDQIYLGPAPSSSEVSDLLAALEAGGAPAELGRRSLLPASLGLSGQQAVDGIFGRGFFDRTAAGEPGEWAAPVQSGYGIHAVRITGTREPVQPELEAVRDAVEDDWRAAAAEDLAASVFAEMEARYAISFPSPDVLEGFLK